MPKAINFSLLTNKLIDFASGLTCTEKGVLRAIAEHLGRKKVAWPSYSTIAHYAAIDRSTAFRTVLKLKERKLLVVIDPGGCDSTNRYEIGTRALARLITKPKYQKRILQYLRRLGLAQASGCTVQPGVDAERKQGVCRVPPESPRKRPLLRSENARPAGASRDDLRSGKGEGATHRHDRHRLPASGEDAQLSDFIRDHELSETFANVEVIKLAENDNPMVKSSLPPDTVASRVVKLMKEVKQEAGRYPSAFEIVAATNDEVFAGLRQLSWGLLTASGKGNKRELFKQLLLSRVHADRQSLACRVENAASAHDRQLGEQKRDTLMQGRWFDIRDDDAGDDNPGDDNQPCLKTFLSELDD